MFPHPQFVPDARPLQDHDRRKARDTAAARDQPAQQPSSTANDGPAAHSFRAGSSGSDSRSSAHTHSRFNSDEKNSAFSTAFSSFDSGVGLPPPAALARARQPSATASVAEKIGEFVAKPFRRRKKPDKKDPSRPRNRPGILDKPETKKLEDFWNFTYPERHSDQDNGRQLDFIASNTSPANAKPHPESAPRRSPPRLTLQEFLRQDPALPTPPPPPLLLFNRPHSGFRLPSISERSHETGTSDSPIMDHTRLMPLERDAADQKDKARRVKDAQAMYDTVKRNADKSNAAVPPYEFLELIGKGAYGRVYKCRDKKSGNLVAVKIAEVEHEDWAGNSAPGQDRDASIREIQKEVRILQTLKDNNAKNINVIHEAFDLHSQLWIVTDYCTGGSVRTLQRPFHLDGKPAGFPEHFIIPIARELAVAMKSLHDMHIIHRDIKAANIYITEEGALQLGDFGVTGVAEDDRFAKRKTIIGTKHYMPLELLQEFDKTYKDQGYGAEVDVYAYGCTMIELATGVPPFANIAGDDLDADVVAESPPRLVDDAMSQDLKDLTNACLSQDPDARPTTEEILKHPAIAGTESTHPTGSLIKLIEKFKLWEHGGGSRISLWWGGGADRPNAGDESGDAANDSDDADGWTFSTSDEFDRRFSQMPILQADDLELLQAPPGAGLPPILAPLDTKVLTIAERIRREHSELSANRGEKSLARLYDINDPSGYQIEIPKSAEEPEPASDLPLREFTAGAPTRESMIEIDLDDVDGSSLSLPMEDTIRPHGRAVSHDGDDSDVFDFANNDDKRATMEWTFPSSSQPKRDTMGWTFPTTQAPQPKRGTMEWTFQTAQSSNGNETAMPLESVSEYTDFGAAPSSAPPRESISSMIDLDLGFSDPAPRLEDPANIVRPATASSTTESVMTDTTSGNPFDLEDDPVQNELDRKRFSHHKPWQSDGGYPNGSSRKDMPMPMPMPMHTRESSLSSTDSDEGHPGGFHMSPQDSNQWPDFSNFDTFQTTPPYQKFGESQYANGLQEPIELSSDVIQIPTLQPPRPEALIEGADVQLLEDELHRSLNGLAAGLKGVEQALRRYASIEDDPDYGAGSDVEGGFESAKEGMDDRAQLTSRRTKPRKLDLRGTPRPSTADG